MTSFKAKLSTATLPTGYSTCLKQDSVEFYYPQWNDSSLIAPKMGVRLTNSKALKLLIYVNDAPAVKSSYGPVSKADKLTTVTELGNILAFCTALFIKSTPDYHLPANIANSLITSLKAFYSALLDLAVDLHHCP